jgi:chemotaxis protein MotB
MAKLQKKPQEDHSNDWLSTYSDMVTLLLTFFVMLYASSSVDEQKWQYIYQAFQSRGKYLNLYVDTPNPNDSEGEAVSDDDPNSSGGDGELPQSFDVLYQYLSDYVEENQLGEYVTVDQGAAHITIRFDDSIFFEADSYTLKDEGKEILRGISPALTAVESSIKTCTVSGHTADVISATNDWELSALRACSVVNYLDFRTVLPTDKFRVKGSGSAEPIAENDTAEGRAKNRRVEMMILKNDLDLTDPEVLADILGIDYGLGSEKYDPDATNTDDTDKLPNDSAQLIINNIESLFPDSSSFASGYDGPVISDDFSSFIYSADDAEEENDDAADDGSGE